VKHKVISVDDPESFKESILDVVQWTEVTLREHFRKILDKTLVTEDAGVIVPHYIRTYTTPRAVVAWMELEVTSTAISMYKPRLDAAAKLLAKSFHVEQSQREGDRDEITIHRIHIWYEYPRAV
jgi:hypothetical protein